MTPLDRSLRCSYTWGLDLSGSSQGAGGVGGLLATTVVSGSFYPTYDANGNVTEYLDAVGAIASHYEYGPFGENLCATYASVPLSQSLGHGGFRFSTKYSDDETGLLYYGYRYYSSSTGRWLSKDPSDEAGGANLYGMVNNSPVNKIDVLGQYQVDEPSRCAAQGGGRGGVSERHGGTVSDRVAAGKTGGYGPIKIHP